MTFNNVNTAGQTKRCNHCEQAKPVSEFYRQPGTRGVRSMCKVCFCLVSGDRIRASAQRRRAEIQEMRGLLTDASLIAMGILSGIPSRALSQAWLARYAAMNKVTPKKRGEA